MDILTPTTELEAINLMLASIGESPVNTVEDNGLVDAATARTILRATSKRLQQKGWTWNTELELKLTRSFPDKTITLPPNVLKADTSGVDAGVDVVQRGLRLYDRKEHTYAFDHDLTVDMVIGLPFDELPEAARQFCVVAAGRKFQQGFVGSQTLDEFTKRDELLAWSDLINAEADAADYNVFAGLEALYR